MIFSPVSLDLCWVILLLLSLYITIFNKHNECYLLEIRMLAQILRKDNNFIFAGGLYRVIIFQLTDKQFKGKLSGIKANVEYT